MKKLMTWIVTLVLVCMIVEAAHAEFEKRVDDISIEDRVWLAPALYTIAKNTKLNKQGELTCYIYLTRFGELHGSDISPKLKVKKPQYLFEKLDELEFEKYVDVDRLILSKFFGSEKYWGGIKLGEIKILDSKDGISSGLISDAYIIDQEENIRISGICKKKKTGKELEYNGTAVFKNGFDSWMKSVGKNDTLFKAVQLPRMATLKSPTRGRVKIPRRQKIKI